MPTRPQREYHRPVSYWASEFPVVGFPRLTHFGYCSSESGRSIPPHHHIGYEFLYVEAGDAPLRMTPGSGPIDLHAHDCMLVAPGHEHSFIVPSCGAEYYWLGVQTDAEIRTTDRNYLSQRSLIQRERNSVHVVGPDGKFEDLRALATAVSTRPVIILRRVPMIGMVFRDIERELDEIEPANTFLLYAKLIELFAWFQKRQHDTVHDGASELMRHLVTHVETSLTERHSVGELAEYAGVSARQLQRLFREQLGCSPSRFVEQERVRRACQLLISGVRPSETAKRVGFGSHEQFSRRFKAQMGLTPGQYQKSSTLAGK